MVRIITRRRGTLYIWLPEGGVWLDLESADLDVALRDFYFVKLGASKLGDRPEPIVIVPPPEGPWWAITYDQAVAPHPGLRDHLRARGYRVARRSKRATPTPETEPV